MEKEKYDILSPDGFPIEANGGYHSIKKAKESFAKWKKRYIQQGYYSSNYGRISLSSLYEHCTLIKL